LRSDWNGEVLTLRASDLTALGAILNIASGDVMSWARTRNLVLTQ
jgi:hypothetical protein